MNGETATGRHGATGAAPGTGAAPAWRFAVSPLGLFALLALLSLALLVAPAHADPLDDQTRQVAKQLQCPVCAGQTVADSGSGLAEQMRGIIRKKLEAGEQPEQIVQYFVERYGDGILTEPPRRGLSLAVWWAPVAILAGGAVLLVAILRAWRRPRPEPAPVGAIPVVPNGHATAAAGASPDPYTAQAEQELAQFLESQQSRTGGKAEQSPTGGKG